MAQRRAVQSWVAIAVAGVLVTLVSACTSTPPQPVRDDAHFEDNDAPAYSGAIIFRPDDMRYGQSGKGGRGGLEFGYERYRGKSEQFVDFNHYLQLGSASLSGPQILAHTVDLQHGHLAYNHLFNFGNHFEVEPMLGFAYDKVYFTSEGVLPTTRMIKQDQHNVGFLARVTPRFMIYRYIGLEARFGVGVDFDGEDSTYSHAALLIRPIPNFELKAGYYGHEQNFDFLSGTSDLNASFEGFFGQLTVVF